MGAIRAEGRPSARPVAQLRQRELLDQIDWEDLRAGDQLLLIVDPAELEVLDRLLAPTETPDHLSDQAFFGEFVLNGEARLGDVANAYGLAVLEQERDLTLDAFLRDRLETQVVVESRKARYQSRPKTTVRNSTTGMPDSPL